MKRKLFAVPRVIEKPYQADVNRRVEWPGEAHRSQRTAGLCV